MTGVKNNEVTAIATNDMSALEQLMNRHYCNKLEESHR
jgi:hypothetical protein